MRLPLKPPTTGEQSQRRSRRQRICHLVPLALLPFTVASVIAHQAGAQETYGYYYKGELVTLTASPQFVAVSETGTAFRSFVATQRLERDPLSEHPGLQAHGLALYRLPAPAVEGAQRVDLRAELVRFAEATPEEIQPVFEQGQALLIPTNEIIVGFSAATTLQQVQDFAAGHRDAQGIVEVRAHRANSFIMVIDNPANGRVYQVSQFLSGLDGVEFAEPNHIVVPVEAPRIPMRPGETPTRGGRQGGGFGTTHNSPVTWTDLVTEGFEGGALPAGWTTGRLNNTFTNALWNVTAYRAHADSHSAYATGGGNQGVAAPGDYPNNASSWLDTPQLDLAAYEEVYIEAWFYAKFQDPVGCWVNDYGRVAIRELTTGVTTFLNFLAICEEGDLTADVTTDNGWRRALVRVPPDLRVDSVRVRFVFESNANTTEEGLYIDEVRIVGTTDVDTEPLGTDDYSARHYEYKNAGQIAGLGDDNDDMNVPEAWNRVTVSTNVVVAVIDGGVDTLHPDLNLVPGYDHDGTSGGHHRGSHGTAVAGNVGAIGDNAIGVMGAAPGVSIMPIYGGSQSSHLANAIDVAVQNGADILTNSWGWVGAPSASIEAAITDALDSGRVVLFAAGNGPDRSPWTYDVAFPGSLNGTTDVICVGASSPTDEHKAAASSDGQFGWGSSYIGDGPDVVAPGPWSYTTDIQGADGYNDGSEIDPADAATADYTCCFGGTSSSTPKVAGVVALMLSADPTLSPAEVKTILRNTAEDIDVPGVDDKTGAGRVNADAAVAQSIPEDCCVGCGAAAMVALVPLFGAAWWRRRISEEGEDAPEDH